VRTVRPSATRTTARTTIAKNRNLSSLELADKTLKLYQPVEIHRKKDELEDHHGIEIVEITLGCRTARC